MDVGRDMMEGSCLVVVAVVHIGPPPSFKRDVSFTGRAVTRVKRYMIVAGVTLFQASQNHKSPSMISTSPRKEALTDRSRHSLINMYICLLKASSSIFEKEKNQNDRCYAIVLVFDFPSISPFRNVKQQGSPLASYRLAFLPLVSFLCLHLYRHPTIYK